MNRATLVPILLGALVFAGCASPGPGPTAPPSSSNRVAASTTAGADFNDADVMFLQMMIPHHGQAVEIARLAKTKATRKEIRDLAAAVEATQVSEAESMTAWLRAWGKPTEADTDPNAHAHHGGMPATSKDVINALAKGGPTFDRDAVNVLTGHQHGAVEMARTELKDGRNPQAKQLADRIVQSRTAQIQQLLTLLGQS
ncbi:MULTISPECIES: DUF305 domain-containing protein [unclassified Crossiella]|uniref:DUF305 domain-containing protein n=1 Tax=unclassified Crossiella TaxID=2620835 RepID=UPI001FFF1FD6|nr:MULTISPECIES: DUF305 domain-containing protein [unclassified Crossiella]MCK2241727.1 DUF305 domain-containing protein [Crossiella sp. S99.2]MCK2255401.1 DUF305 domain-containing protein [Crossiella sp. S99.1]